MFILQKKLSLKKALVVLVSILAVLFMGYQEAAAVLIDFNSFNAEGTNDISGNEFESDGIIFTTTGLALNLAPPTSFNPVNCLGADSPGGTPFFGKVVFQFTGNRISNDLQFVVLSRFGSSPVNAFDINGNIIFTQNVLNNLGAVTINLAGLPVHRVEVTGNPGCIYNISFTLSVLPDVIEDQVIGGKIIPVEQTALFLAGAQSSLAWILPVALAAIGAATFKLKQK